MTKFWSVDDSNVSFIFYNIKYLYAFQDRPQFEKLDESKMCNFNEVNFYLSKIEIIDGKNLNQT